MHRWQRLDREHIESKLDLAVFRHFDESIFIDHIGAAYVDEYAAWSKKPEMTFLHDVLSCSYQWRQFDDHVVFCEQGLK